MRSKKLKNLIMNIDFHGSRNNNCAKRNLRDLVKQYIPAEQMRNNKYNCAQCKQQIIIYRLFPYKIFDLIFAQRIPYPKRIQKNRIKPPGVFKESKNGDIQNRKEGNQSCCPRILIFTDFK